MPRTWNAPLATNGSIFVSLDRITVGTTPSQLWLRVWTAQTRRSKPTCASTRAKPTYLRNGGIPPYASARRSPGLRGRQVPAHHHRAPRHREALYLRPPVPFDRPCKYRQGARFLQLFERSHCSRRSIVPYGRDPGARALPRAPEWLAPMADTSHHPIPTTFALVPVDDNRYVSTFMTSRVSTERQPRVAPGPGCALWLANG
jgi:hypothetical protein